MIIPLNIDQIRLGDFLEFKRNEKLYFQDQDPEFLRVAMRSVMLDVDDIPLNIEGDEKKTLIGNYLIPPGEGISLMRIYAHFVNLINAYKCKKRFGKKFTIKYNNEVYILHADKLMNLVVGDPVTSQELVVQKEMDRNLSSIEFTLLEDNIDFSINARCLSVLCLKDKEVLPINFKKRQAFLDEREKVFDKMPLDLIFPIRWFVYKQMEVLNTSIHEFI